MKVPFFDLTEQFDLIRDEALNVIEKVCYSKKYLLGENVAKLEEEFAHSVGSKFAVGCASGSDALILALMAKGVVPGDRIITTPFNSFSTAGAIARLGALPVFVDIDPKTFNMDPVKLERRLSNSTNRIKAVIPVHLYGQCAPMIEINTVLKKYKIPTIEDASQSIGATYGAKQAGTLGEVGCFSFSTTKNLSSFGEGGMLTTNNEALATKLKRLRANGAKSKYYHDEVGINSPLDELQASVLRVKLKHLEKWTEDRINNARTYERYFKSAGLDKIIKLPVVAKSNKSVFNRYAIQSDKRDKLRAFLATKEVETEIHYPIPLHMQKCFIYLGYKMGAFPVAENVAWNVLSLPMYPELKAEQIEFTVEQIKEFFKEK